MAYLGQRTFATFEKKSRGWGDFFEEDEELYGDLEGLLQDQKVEISNSFGESTKIDDETPVTRSRDELLNTLYQMGVNISHPQIVKATDLELEILQTLLQKFQEQQAGNYGGKFNLDNLTGSKQLVYYVNPKMPSKSSYLQIWLTPRGNSVHISIYFSKEGGFTIYRDRLVYNKEAKIFENQDKESIEYFVALQNSDQTNEGQHDLILNNEIEEITKETQKEQLTVTESKNDIIGIGETASEQDDIIENPSDVLYEKVPSGKWNNTGYSFFRRDGKLLTSKEVYAFIREQKKQSNDDLTEAFKPHIKGKNTEGTYPTFEIKNSKHRYYGYSFDPEWGKKKETAKEADITADDKKYIGREVHETAFVKVRTAEREKFTGIRLYDFPSPDGKNSKGKGAKVYDAGTPLTIIAHGNAVASGWILVQTPDGQTGWIAQNWTLEAKTGDNTRYTLRYVNKGETITDLLREITDVDRDIGYDNKLFANALWLLNKDNPDVFINQSKYKQSITANAAKNAVDPWDAEKRAILQSIEVKQGAQVKVPTKQTIDLMIASGQIEVRPDWVTAGVKTARIIEGLMTGIPIGIYEQAKDTVTGIWELIKSIFTGEILDQLVDLYDALWAMSWDDVKKLLWGLLGVDPDEFDKIWNSKNITTVERYKFIGEIIGRLIFEIILMVFTGGVALAKYGAKIPALAKLASSLKKVERIIPDNIAGKLRKTEKAVDKVDEAVVPLVVKTEKTVGSMLAPYKTLRGKLDEVKGKIGNENFTKFDEQLRQLPDEVLKKLDDNPDILEAFAKRSLDDPDFFKAVKKGDLSKLDELKRTNKGKDRADLFSAKWPKASLRENIKKFAPGAKGLKTSSGKTIYKNPKTGIQVVYDEAGKYFRIEDTNLTGKRKYLDLDGNIPNNKIVNGKQMGRTTSEYEEVTHFLNID